MQAILAGLSLKEIFVLILAVFFILFILKKLIKLAVVVAVLAALIHFGLPIIQNVMLKM